MYPVPREYSNGAELVREARAVRARLWPRAVLAPTPAAQPEPPLVESIPEPEPIAAEQPAEPEPPAEQPPEPEDPRVVQLFHKRTKAERIKKMIALAYGITRAEIEGAHHRRACSYPRFIAFYLCVRHAGLSFPHTGRVFGGRDHTTVLHGVRKITHDMAGDLVLAETIAEFVRQIEEWSGEPRAETGG